MDLNDYVSSVEEIRSRASRKKSNTKHQTSIVSKYFEKEKEKQSSLFNKTLPSYTTHSARNNANVPHSAVSSTSFKNDQLKEETERASLVGSEKSLEDLLNDCKATTKETYDYIQRTVPHNNLHMQQVPSYSRVKTPTENTRHMNTKNESIADDLISILSSSSSNNSHVKLVDYFWNCQPLKNIQNPILSPSPENKEEKSDILEQYRSNMYDGSDIFSTNDEEVQSIIHSQQLDLDNPEYNEWQFLGNMDGNHIELAEETNAVEIAENQDNHLFSSFWNDQNKRAFY